MSINHKSPKSVIIVGYEILHWLYLIIIPVLKKKYNCNFVVIASESSRFNYNKVLNKKEDLFISLDNSLKNTFSEGYSEEVFKEEELARNNETLYDLNYMRDIIQQDRQLSTYFLSHAANYIWGKNTISSNEKLIKLINGYFKFSEHLIKKYKFDMAIIWPVDGLSATLAGILESKNVLVTFPYNSKYKSYGFWTSSAFLDNSKLKYYYDRNQQMIDSKQDVMAKPASGYISLDKLDTNYSRTVVLKRILKIIFFRIEFLILDILKLDFTKKKRVSILRNILFHIHSRRMYKFFNKFSVRDINLLKKPFLFYALSLEPEFSVQGRSKEFNDQGAIIKQLALNMPAGYELIIKEHVDIGRRSNEFYTTLLRLPNVRMVHPSIKGEELVKKSRAVASLVGTVSLEASLLGKNVIEFSLHSSFSFLSNIWTITDFTNLNKIINKVMTPLSKSIQLKIKKNALKIVKAIEKSSFEAKETPLFYGKRTYLDAKDTERTVELLIETYNIHNTK